MACGTTMQKAISAGAQSAERVVTTPAIKGSIAALASCSSSTAQAKINSGFCRTRSRKRIGLLLSASLVLAPWACLVLWALHHRILPDAAAAWLEQRERGLGPRLQRLLRWGKGPAVLLLGATVGPLSALLGIRLFGFAAPRRYLLAVEAAAAYCLVWTGLVYSGGWLLLRHLLAQLWS